MIQTKVVKSTTSSGLESKINNALKEIAPREVIDIKVAGSSNGKEESFIAVVMYKA